MKYALFSVPVGTIYDLPQTIKEGEEGLVSTIGDEGLYGQACQVRTAPGGVTAAGVRLPPDVAEVVSFYGYHGYVDRRELQFVREEELWEYLGADLVLVGRATDVLNLPKVQGVRQILEEWTAWRTDSVKRRIFFVLGKKKDKLHLLKGLKRILLDIDKAIKIIRETEEESEVIPNLMIGFGIDQVQAEYVAEIKLRNINKEYILKRTRETDALRDEIDDLEDLLNSPKRVKKVIVEELNAAAKKYGEPRRTSIVYPHEITSYTPEEEQKEEYPVSIFLSREGYFKKITPASLRMNSEQKFKEGDVLRQSFETTSNAEAMFFTDHCQVYKTRLGEFDDAKASVLGDYLPTKLKMDAGENVIFMVLPGADYAGSLLFFYENGKVARIEMKAYQTASNRRKLTGAYSDKSPLACIRRLDEDCELAVYSNEPRCLIFHTALLAPKTTRSAQGVAVMTLKPKYHLETVLLSEETSITNWTRYRVRAIPATGALVKEEDSEDQQISLL